MDLAIIDSGCDYWNSNKRVAGSHHFACDCFCGVCIKIEGDIMKVRGMEENDFSIVVSIYEKVFDYREGFIDRYYK